LLRLLPRLFGILTKKRRASMSWVLPLRLDSLLLVSCGYRKVRRTGLLWLIAPTQKSAEEQIEYATPTT
jgi:hypothetical protein